MHLCHLKIGDCAGIVAAEAAIDEFLPVDFHRVEIGGRGGGGSPHLPDQYCVRWAWIVFQELGSVVPFGREGGICVLVGAEEKGAVVTAGMAQI